MSSEEEPDLPVVADVHTVADGVLNENDLHAVLRDEEIVEEGDEFYKKSDAEEAIQKARQAERQKILDKIDDRRTRASQKIETDSPYTPLKIRKATLADLRDELEEEAEA